MFFSKQSGDADAKIIFSFKHQNKTKQTVINCDMYAHYCNITGKKRDNSGTICILNIKKLEHTFTLEISA